MRPQRPQRVKNRGGEITTGAFNIKVDGQEIPAYPGQSILEAALDAGIYIPHLCHHHDLPDAGACGLCVAEVDGKTIRSCCTEAKPGMEADTKTPALEHIRAVAMQLMLAGHIDDCNSCPKYLKCEFQMLIQYQGSTVGNLRRTNRDLVPDEGNPLFIRDMERCVACSRCLRVCRYVRGVGAIVYGEDSGGRRLISTKASTLRDSDCRFCGACVEVCPTGALRDRDGVFAQRFARGEELVPCTYECPAHVDVPAYIRAVREGRDDDAMAIVMERAPLPRTLGAVCMRFCEGRCRRAYLDAPVTICALKRYAAENAAGAWRKNLKPSPDTGRRVAVIGSGPAGLTAAWLLRLKGHAVTIFEKLPLPGGMARYGMPAYRLGEAELAADIDEILKTGVELICGREITAAEELGNFDAALWCGGTHKGIRLPLSGADAARVYTGVDFLRAIRMGERPDMGGRVLVLGGGDVAFDCARSAVRLGAKAALCCLEAENAMPATEREYDEGTEEGVIICAGRSFTGIVLDGERVVGVDCMRVASLERDENGRIHIETVPGSEERISCDSVVFAVGQQPDIPAGLGIELGAGGLAAVDGECMTSRPGLFAAGDAAGGTSSVAQAVGWGQRAAAGIDKYLGGGGDVLPHIAPRPAREKNIADNPRFSDLKQSGKQLPAAERIKSFCPFEAALTDSEAQSQSSRCLQCDLRTEITRPRFYSEYAYKKEARR